jgi:hypothetical protein
LSVLWFRRRDSGYARQKLESVANGLQDLGAGFELVSKAMRDTRQELVTFNANLKTYTTRIDAADKATKGFIIPCRLFSLS